MCLVAALLMLAIHYLSVISDLDSKYYDLITVTARDFSVMIDISKKQSDLFRQMFYEGKKEVCEQDQEEESYG